MKSTIFNTVLRGRKVALTALVVTAMAASAYASPVTITNGDFNTSSNHSSELSNGSYSGATVNGWANNGSGAYNFVFIPGDTSANSSFGSNNVSFYTPTNNATNNPTHNPNFNPYSSPAGGSFLALDSDYGQGAITQTISGLVYGDTVSVTFDWAGAQQDGFNGASTDYLAVSLGGQTQDTATIHDASHGFTGWNTTTLNFTVTSHTGSEVLSFFAVGTPSGVPSFVLLDGVSATQTDPPGSPVPEPASLALLSTGLVGIGGLVRRRFSK